MRRSVLPSLLLAALLTGCGAEDDRAGEPGAQRSTNRATAPRPAPAPRPKPGRVTTPQLAGHLRALSRAATANGGTRAAGTPGDRATADHIAAALRRAGWRTSTQRVRFPFFDERRAPRLTLGGKRQGGVRTMAYSDGGDVAGPLRPVALTFGEDSRSGCDRADLAAVRTGDVVLLQRGTCTLRRKAANAAKEGAVAVLIANDGRPGRTDAIRGTLASPGVDVPVLSLTTATGRRLASRAGSRVRVRVDAVSETRTTRNVLAEQRGGTPGRVLVAGAHLDSVTEGPGLNDNGSGVAAVLSGAERLGPTARPGRARVRVGFWGAEELGLIGSKRYVASLSKAERRRIRGYVNLDMVGSPNGVPFVYDGDARIETALRGAVRGQARTPERTDIGGSSDHASFRRAAIPVGGLYTGARETKSATLARRHGGRAGRPYDACYHRACDKAGNVDRAVARDMAEALRRALLGLARGRV